MSFQVQRGNFRASDTIPADQHLIELWSPNSQPLKKTHPGGFSSRSDKNSDIYYEGITFRKVLFDSSFQGGRLFAIYAVRIRINNCFFIHFTTDGILVHKHHETISNCFSANTPQINTYRIDHDFSSTAIDLASNDLASNDNAVTNMLTGVHCYNKATSFGGVGIVVKAGQTRINSCYLDFNSILIEDPFQVIVSNGFFLGDGNIVMKVKKKDQISGLSIVNNVFSRDPKNMVPIVKLEGQFTKVDQVVIEWDEVVINGGEGNGARKWDPVGGDFSSVMVFPNRINRVQYSFGSK
ncbi:hypothetical protein U1Q18_010181 [Sarracenia purpurea var. burkii]